MSERFPIFTTSEIQENRQQMEHMTRRSGLKPVLHHITIIPSPWSSQLLRMLFASQFMNPWKDTHVTHITSTWYFSYRMDSSEFRSIFSHVKFMQAALVIF